MYGKKYEYSILLATKLDMYLLTFHLFLLLSLLYFLPMSCSL